MTNPTYEELAQRVAELEEELSRHKTAKPKQTNGLRRRAEDTLANRSDAIEDLPLGDSKALLHEVLVHQTELEMQNEELLRTQSDLHASRDKYLELYDFAPVGFLTLDRNGLIVQANLTAAHLLGAERENLIKRRLSAFVSPDSQDSYYFHLKRVRETTAKEACELTLVRKDGTSVEGQITSMAAQGADGEFNDIHMAITDITPLKQASDALQEEYSFRSAVIEQAADGICVFHNIDAHPDIRFTVWNARMAEITGYTMEEMNRLGWYQTMYPDPEVQKRAIERMAGMRAGTDIREEEWIITTKGGENKPLSISTSVLREKGGKVHVLAMMQDISARKLAEKERQRLEARLRQTQKNEAIATLAGGIAHQFNNALSAITMNIELLAMDAPGGEKTSGYLENMKKSSDRMAHLTKQLLGYARGGRYQPEMVSLNNFVTNTLPLLRNALPSCLRVEADLPRNIWDIEADLTQMQLVLSAILTNASEAIEGEGKIRISVKNEEIGDAFAQNHAGMKPGPYVCMAVQDDGKGMDRETRNRVFEPFFSTKFQGRGLGMAATYGIVKNHNGWISVDSKPGMGTVVRVYLPAVETRKREEKPTRIEPSTRKATILVVEDEEMVMNATRAIVERLGHRVLEAKAGEEAIHIAGTFDGDIDVAILDIKLPDMEGHTVFSALMEARPNLKIIVCSGYSCEEVAQSIMEAGAQAYVQKPFSLARISEKLREVLGD